MSFHAFLRSVSSFHLNAFFGSGPQIIAGNIHGNAIPYYAEHGKMFLHTLINAILTDDERQLVRELVAQVDALNDEIMARL